MRRNILLALLAATVIAPLPAAAQDGGRDWQRSDRQHGSRPQRQEAPAQAQPQAPAQAQAPEPVARPQRVERQRAQAAPGTSSSGPWVGNPNDPARARYERLERQNAREYGSPAQARQVIERQRQEGRMQGRDYGRDQRDGRDYGRDRQNGGNYGRGDWRQGQDQGRNWNQGNRQNEGNWNRSWRNDQRYDWRRFRDTNRYAFHIDPYYAPYRGYGYTRFGIGSVLDALFFGQDYWISDPWSYRLPPAPYGTQWVRYFNDVVLVDTYSGEVVDVIYDFFW